MARGCGRRQIPRLTLAGRGRTEAEFVRAGRGHGRRREATFDGALNNAAVLDLEGRFVLPEPATTRMRPLVCS